MDKHTKIIAIILVAIIAVFVVIVGVTTTLMNDNNSGVSDVTVSDTTPAPTVPANTEPTVQAAQTTVPEQTTQTEQTTSEVTQTTAGTALNELILGKWTDSANMSGYEFFADGRVEMTYVNLTVPIINVPVNGVSKGTYVLQGDTLTTKFSIYSATIENTYTVSITDSTLSMRDHEDGETATYSKTSSSSVTTTTVASDTGVVLSDEIVGAWINADGSVRYRLNSDSTAEISFTDANVTSISTSVLNGKYNGIYLTDDTSIIIQFAVNGNKVTQKFDFSVSRNTLSLTDETGSTDFYVREGTGFVASGESDLIGKWTDGAEMSGYEFKEGGVVEIIYVNFTVPVINMPINGTFTGSYSVNGNTITISYFIYGKSVVDNFEYSIASNTLSLKSADGNVSTYIKK